MLNFIGVKFIGVVKNNKTFGIRSGRIRVTNSKENSNPIEFIYNHICFERFVVLL